MILVCFMIKWEIISQDVVIFARLCLSCRSLTSSTMDSTVLPATVSPDIEALLLRLFLIDPVLACVQRYGVLIVDSIALVMKQQNLRGQQREPE